MAGNPEPNPLVLAAFPVARDRACGEADSSDIPGSPASAAWMEIPVGILPGTGQEYLAGLSRIPGQVIAFPVARECLHEQRLTVSRRSAEHLVAYR